MRKIFTLLILLLLLPVTALAAGDAPAVLYVGNYQITNTSGTTYLKAGSTRGSLEEGSETDWTVKYAPTTATLTLKGAKISGSYHQYNNPYTAGIYALCSKENPVSLTIELIGTNTITGNHGIFVNAEIGTSIFGADASLTITGENNGSLEVSGSNHGIYVKSGTGNASLNIKNVAVTSSTNGNYAAGVYVMSSVGAINSPQLSLAVDGGSLTTSGTESSDGILFYVGSSQATGATTSLTVTNNAIVDARNGGISASIILDPLPTPTPTGDNSSGIVFDGTEGTVYGDVTLDESLTINQGETLTVPEGSSLNCNDNLTNNGTIIVEKGGNLTGEPGDNVVYAPTITTHPKNVEVKENETATFTVEATGSDLSYQWQQNTNGSAWTDITGETNATYTIATTTMNINGTQYRCVVSNSAGSVTSNAVTLTVNAATVSVTGVTLEPTSLSLFTGDTAPLTATVQPSDATNQNVTWSSDNAEVATVEGGTVTAVGAGETTITVQTQDGNHTATCIVTVTVPVTGVKLNKETLELFTDGSETLTATVEPGNATNKNVTWSSSVETIATVDNNGTVTAVGAGEATITATAGGITATCVVHVRKPATVEASGSTNLSFTTDRDEFSLTATVHAQGNDLNPKDGSWTWTVADADVVALSGSPTWRSQSYSISRQAFTIEGTGTTTITAIYDDGTYRGSVDFKVRISKPSPPDPISYYNIYVEDVCDGVEVSTSKQVVREGGSINVYVEKDTANYTFDNFHVYYKEGYYDSWDELKEGTQPGEYPIKNIWTHIYIKAEGAEEKEDPTGIESIEGVKVYTKDGSLYVQTPQREQVIIVSMSGAVVKNEEQIGLKQYHGLQPGIYIVRVGDRAYKVRLN